MTDQTKVIDSWSEIGVTVNPNASNVKVLCPECSSTRKHKNEKCLSVNPSKGVANCHHCQTNYVIRTDSLDYQKKVYAKPKETQVALSAKGRKFFNDRMIGDKVLEKFNINESTHWMYARGEAKEGETRCINFNYYQNGELVNIKFRASEKRFMMATGAKLIFYNIDAIRDVDTCIITEGEPDTLSCYQANVGIEAASVPNGAPKTGSPKMDYLDHCIGSFENKKKIIIATDDDDAGRNLREELIRRLGRERCWTIEYPDGCKDTNDTLVRHGASAVREMYRSAREVPLDGVEREEDVYGGAMDIYHNGYPSVLSIGFKDMDDLIKWRVGEFTTITAIPGAGKSEVVDQIMVRLAARHGWKCAIFSPEHQPVGQHAGDLAMKFLGGRVEGQNKVSLPKMEIAMRFVNHHFSFMKVSEIDCTMDGILNLARQLVIKKGIKMLLIDPYNYIEHRIPMGMTETNYVSQILSKLANFCRDFGVHCILIAHPRKMEKSADGTYKVPGLYDINGSANFYNKTFNGMAIERIRSFDPSGRNADPIRVHVQKVKFKYVGREGHCDFVYNVDTGQYAHHGQPFESELDRYIHAQSQPDLTFEEPELPEVREPGQLTDIRYLPLKNAPF